VIVAMRKIQILGPRAQLVVAIQALQDVGSVHLCRPDLQPPVAALSLSARQLRHVARVEAALDDVEEALASLTGDAVEFPLQAETRVESLAREVRLARRARRAARALEAERRAFADEREQLAHLARVVSVFADMKLSGHGTATRTFFLVMSQDVAQGESRLGEALSEAIGDAFVLHVRPIAGGETAVALQLPAALVGRVEALLPGAGVRELALPASCAGQGPEEWVEALHHRLAAVEDELASFAARRKRLADWLQPGLLRARTAFNDWLLRARALASAAVTPHLFVLEGWLPASESDRVAQVLAARVGEQIVVEDVARETWSVHDVPVAIVNPRLFRSFEVITRRLPLPRYGTMDPTPFVAVFFPMFFGLMLGDIGYGTMLAVLAAIGWRRSAAGSVLRSLSEIAAACSIFSILFGVFFGEFFGDLGHRVLGLRAVAFSREEAFVPFLALSISIGFVHMLLGLILGALSSFRSDPRHSLGRGLAAVMLVLSAGVLLAALNVLPGAFFTPAVVALLLSFPLLIAIEGVIGPIELLSRLSNILSYARIMALGTASVMLAVVANRMVGAFGGVVVGVLFATLFHLVNFGLGVFSPTIHALRLHFVEFFGTFYSPGGLVYRPLQHWRPAQSPAIHEA
jgi:V/A-type H+-transporting ATPase subunit I